MSTHKLSIQPNLTDDELAAIDQFCASHRGIDSLPELADFLKKELDVALVLEPDVVEGFAVDSSNLPGHADALARPVTERECAMVLHACHQAGIPVTISGGKSNLTGSATPQGGVVLSTVKMTSTEAPVDLEARTVEALPGMILEDLRKQVLDVSGGELEFPVDPTSRAEASIGGAIACNCSGFTPGETGAFRPWLKSIRFLLPDGQLIEAERGQYISQDGVFELPDTSWPVPRYVRPQIKNAGGPYSAPDGALDFIDLVVGSEGIFGLVTGCTLQLAPRPDAYLDIFFSLKAESDALKLLNAVFGKYGTDLSCLKAFEYFGVNCRNYMTHEKQFFPGDNAVGIYIQEPLNGRDEMDVAEEWLELLDTAEMDVDEDSIILLDTPKLRELFMEARHSMPANALEVVQQRQSFTIMTDTVVPPEHFAEFLDFTHGMLAEKQLDYLSFGHFGDCHLHFTVLPHVEQLDSAVDAYDRIVKKSTDLGGVYSGEHGTGKRKRKDFLCCYGETAIDQLRATRAAVDPNLLLNRGNVFPSDEG
jgi:D-lactate dehydrogenase (cytochrome)